ncbi:MAG: tetratricopeptide repeat protein [Alphaproteobacteria bacterium]|nr:tetratricopeptide repeat protein [Alphaproteobacteria bacterium]
MAVEPGPSVTEALQRAFQFHKTGQIQKAEKLYRNILSKHPDNADANHLLGFIGNEHGHFEKAIRLIEKSIHANPRFATAHNTLAISLLGLKRYEDALETCDRALEIDPGLAEAHNNRGNALQGLKRYEDALESHDRAIAINPLVAIAHNNRGNTLAGLKRYEEALESFECALALNPDYAEAHNNRGNALRALNRPVEALESYDKALAIEGDFSATPYDRNDLLNNRGNVLRGLKRYEEAINDYAELFEADPDYPFNRGALFYARAECCDWVAFERETHALSAGVGAGKPLVRPFSFAAFSDSPADQLRCAKTYVENRCPASPTPLWTGERYHHDRIRVAYVSADFHTHPMAFLMAGVFEQHDRSRFETIAISFGPDEPGEMRTRLENAFERFINVREAGSTEIANLIRELEVDIAIDRKGYTQNSRPEIFAERPAPVQAAWLAYPGTVGADYMDYILADRWVIPEDHQRYYSENVVYLPDTYQANDSKRPIAEQMPGRTELGLPETGFVFCSFNANYKITPPVFDIWMRLLTNVEGSVLWLLESNAAAARNLRHEAETRGVAPERLVFAPHMDHADHLARHRLADLFLDTLPFNAHTTTSDALWAGLPVVTCLGTTFAGRVAGSLLNAVGLPELITNSLEEYQELALELTRDKDLLDAIKSKLARNRLTHPLFDTDRMRRHVEAAYEAMWRRHQLGEPPAGFTVPSAKD